MKRYTITTDFYLWAENDSEAIQKANNWANKQNKKEDNQTKILEIHETPFATLLARKINIK